MHAISDINMKDTVIPITVSFLLQKINFYHLNKKHPH
jgi:hypothetical protein